MARTTTVIQRTNRLTGEKDVVEIENKAASAGGDVNGRVYKQYFTKAKKMRLYKSYDGRWAGNLKDAKKFDGYHEMDIPTDKTRLLNFLNNYRVGNVFSEEVV